MFKSRRSVYYLNKVSNFYLRIFLRALQKVFGQLESIFEELGERLVEKNVLTHAAKFLKHVFNAPKTELELEKAEEIRQEFDTQEN